jgi:uncharacterized protein (DUF1501 family)
MGGNLKKTGFWNEAPNLTDLDEGDLKFEIDFRNIYATLLQKHLRTDAKTILGDSFKVLEVL